MSKLRVIGDVSLLSELVDTFAKVWITSTMFVAPAIWMFYIEPDANIPDPKFIFFALGYAALGVILYSLNRKYVVPKQ